jgi:hypothetical protein
MLLLLAACDGHSSDPGLDAELQISGAQFNPGAMPDDGDGPGVIALDVARFAFAPGDADQPLTGTLTASATTVGFALDGDRGWWLMPAGVPDVNAPTLPTFSTRLAIARSAPPGMVTLRARAADERGHFGRSSSVMISVQDAPEPAARLIVTLAWASATDLDLHVVEPGGNEIWSDAPVSPSGGALDLDSNSQCVIDGRDREEVTWAQPPSGHYDVRVDTFSLCGQPVADWQVQVTLDGASLGTAAGQSVASDAYGPHQRGSGREALGFDLE